MKRKIKNTPPRLEHIFQEFTSPLYQVTCNTWKRKRILAQPDVFRVFCYYARQNIDENRSVGRFVIMPDHIHMFIRITRQARLSDFIRLMKQSITKELRTKGETAKVWQPGFFDHLLRSSESYAKEWKYVQQNPVRAGLVTDAADWPYQGEIVQINAV
jgi:putative transposase